MPLSFSIISSIISSIIKPNIALVDLRSSDAFIEQHIKGSCSLSFDRLKKSMHELPANHLPLSLIGSETEVQQASDFLSSKGYEIVEQHTSEAAFWRAAESQNLCESGCHSTALWQANPLLIDVIEQVETVLTARKAIDLACGAGRDSVYLAQRGWQVTSIDYKADALERATQLASRHQTQLTTLLRDLETINDSNTSPVADLSTDLLLIMRYLHRPLYPHMDKLINPGGVLIYSTFMQGSEKFGSPKNPAYLLAPGELASVFSHYDILVDEARKLADGRPVALFVAKKPH